MTTRFPNGISTAATGTPLSDFILPDFTKAHIFKDDFDFYTAANWMITEVGVATQSLTDGDGGLLLLINAAADNDSTFVQKIGESYQFSAGKKLWFDCLFKVSDATQSDVVIGLQISDSTPLTTTNGVFFLKSDGAATVDFLVEKDNVPTITSAITTMVDNVNIRLSFFYDGKNSIKIYAGGVEVGSSVVTNLPDEILTLSFGIQNGEAVAKTMTFDYFFVAKER